MTRVRKVAVVLVALIATVVAGIAFGGTAAAAEGASDAQAFNRAW